MNPNLVIEKTRNPKVRRGMMMSFKSVLLVTCGVVCSACLSEVAGSSPSKKDTKPHTTATKTTDALGDEMINIQSTRNEGYTVHQSSQIEKTTNEFYCEGYKVETFVVERKENQDVRSVDLTFKMNGEKIDLKPIIGNKSNLYGYSNLETHFACVDTFVRVIIEGQAYANDHQLAPSTHIIDFLVDRNTGSIASKSVKK